MLCVLGKKFFFQAVNTVKITVSVKFGAFFHSCERSPALWIDNVGIFKCLFHAVGLCESSAGFFCVLSCDFLNFRHYIVSFRMRKHYIHAHSGHQADDTLRNGEGLSVRRRVGPGHG